LKNNKNNKIYYKKWVTLGLKKFICFIFHINPKKFLKNKKEKDCKLIEDKFNTFY